MTARQFIGIAFRTFLYGVLGAILSGFLIRALLLPFPNTTGDKGLATVLLVFGGVVAGALAAGTGFVTAKLRWGGLGGAVCALAMWFMLMKHVPDEPQLLAYLAVLVIVPTGVGLLGAWIGGVYAKKN
jgi:hypothetical protein